MPTAATAPYGSWASSIGADLIVGESIGLGQIAIDGDTVYWTETRPSERGRTVLMRQREGEAPEEVNAPDTSVRSRVHEYGGGAFAAARGTAWYCNDADQCLYRSFASDRIERLTVPGPWRYADLEPAADGSLFAVREDHGRGGAEPENTLVRIAPDGSTTVVAAGADFYAAPRLSPAGDRLAWLQWSHPNMPWDGCELWEAPLNRAGRPADRRRIAGGSDEALFQPFWSPGGDLHVVSDRSGFWNLYRVQGAELQPLCPMAADFGLPQWVFGMATYGFDAEGAVVAAYAVDGMWRLGRIPPDGGALKPLAAAYCGFDSLRVSGHRAVFVGGRADRLPVLVSCDLQNGEERVLRRSATFSLPESETSIAQPVAFPSSGEGRAHAFYYTPRNDRFVAPKGSLPPLIVRTHGGPTGQTTNALNLKIQFWTSRGFAVLDVNYRGSTGYGRDYRRALRGGWGVVDVDDAVAGAEAMVAAGRADPARLIATGGSAGGYTTLAALTFRNCFAAGASHYGIGDLTTLARDTHKFEGRYLDSLVGLWPAAADRYRARSPVNFPERLRCPTIFFQGLEDKIVPPNQAEAMVAALRGKGVPVAYVAFAGEAHGFRQAANIKRALEGELYFYGRIFGFPIADTVEPVPIDNLEGGGEKE